MAGLGSGRGSLAIGLGASAVAAGVGKSLGSSEASGCGAVEAQPRELRLDASDRGSRSWLARDEMAERSLAVSRVARRGKLASELAVAVPIERDEVTLRSAVSAEAVGRRDE